MAILNFPSNPVANDTISLVDDYGVTHTYIYTGVYWRANNSIKPTSSIQTNFPSSPVANDTYTLNGYSWKFDGKSWASNN